MNSVAVLPTPAPKEIHLIGAEIGEGAPDPRCCAGPRALLRFGLARSLGVRSGSTVKCDSTLRAKGTLALARDFSSRLADRVRNALASGSLPLVIGGDHSCAIGTWSGAAEWLRPRGSLGLVWVDAHLDSHTPQTSHTQALHGMPLAVLMGYGPSELTTVASARRKINPRDVVIVGARSYEDAETELLARLGVRVVHMDEVRTRGFRACIEEAVARVTANTVGWGLSFDLDALDPVDAPGTGTPVPDGIALCDAAAGLASIAEDSRLVAAEIAEYNPARDAERRTAAAAVAIARALSGAEGKLSGLRCAA